MPVIGRSFNDRCCPTHRPAHLAGPEWSEPEDDEDEPEVIEGETIVSDNEKQIASTDSDIDAQFRAEWDALQMPIAKRKAILEYAGGSYQAAVEFFKTH